MRVSEPGANAPMRLPHIHGAGQDVQFLVDEEPFLILGGELRNSSSSNLKYIGPVWQRLADLNLNTVLPAISWELVEPQEGAFDFSLVDGMIAAAREHHLRLILLWFGSWKNGSSGYVPAWVKRDYRRFPLVRRGDGTPVPVLSTFAEANWQADGNAFAALLRHIREVDGSNHTVIMVQVENEVGVLGDSRDRSEAANDAFARPVPDEFLHYLHQHRGSLLPYLHERWERGGFRTSGNWTEMFGDGADTDELFMAWHYARYIDRVAARGKVEYPIPLFANAWLNNTVAFPGFPAGGKSPGDYPSGGPVPQVLDVWQAAAPHLDFLAPDIYAPDFDVWCAAYTHRDNPLFIPETRADPDGMPNLFQAVATFHALGYSPFGIDGVEGDWAAALRTNYGILRQLAPLITAHRGADTMIGFRIDAEQPCIVRELGGYELEIRSDLQMLYDWLGRAPDEPLKPAYGLIVATGPGTYIGAGFGFAVSFRSTAPSTMRVGIEAIEEGEYRDEAWVPGRRLNGDETMTNQFWRFAAGDRPAFGPMPPVPLGSPISRCTVYSYA